MIFTTVVHVAGTACTQFFDANVDSLRIELLTDFFDCCLKVVVE
jgi:hypothetical protein